LQKDGFFILRHSLGGERGERGFAAFQKRVMENGDEGQIMFEKLRGSRNF